MEYVWERLANPEVLFGLAVRFFGVFIVLIILMVAMIIMGHVFMRIREAALRQADSASATEPPPALHPPAAPAPAAGGVPESVAAAIGLALTQYVQGQRSTAAGPVLPEAGRAPEAEASSWKLIGRQEGLFRKTTGSRSGGTRRR